ncbi:MAG: zf-HC2 domain-containing protein [Candidatus Aminicenantes bacterium]|nr:MAG: zf-HC2 domain-containing protein [Candidatus Aminicenantes bacterium]
MKKCKFANLIDDYLFDRLDETQKEKFEEHYFNCPQCFEKMEQTDEMIAVIKADGSEIFRDVYAPQKTKRSKLEPVLAFLTPRQWAMAAASAALILVVAIGIIPNLKTTSPEFFINDDLVRGSSITLISPVINNLSQVPSEFRWQSLGDNAEYKLFIYQQEELLWSTSTKDNFVILSEKTKSLLAPAKKYSWQVKAFSPEGTLIAVSSQVQFNYIATK